MQQNGSVLRSAQIRQSKSNDAASQPTFTTSTALPRTISGYSSSSPQPPPPQQQQQPPTTPYTAFYIPTCYTLGSLLFLANSLLACWPLLHPTSSPTATLTESPPDDDDTTTARALWWANVTNVAGCGAFAAGIVVEFVGGVQVAFPRWSAPTAAKTGDVKRETRTVQRAWSGGKVVPEDGGRLWRSRECLDGEDGVGRVTRDPPARGRESHHPRRREGSATDVESLEVGAASIEDGLGGDRREGDDARGGGSGADGDSDDTEPRRCTAPPPADAKPWGIMALPSSMRKRLQTTNDNPNPASHAFNQPSTKQLPTWASEVSLSGLRLATSTPTGPTTTTTNIHIALPALLPPTIFLLGILSFILSALFTFTHPTSASRIYIPSITGSILFLAGVSAAPEWSVGGWAYWCGSVLFVVGGCAGLWGVGGGGWWGAGDVCGGEWDVFGRECVDGGEGREEVRGVGGGKWIIGCEAINY